jgi:hypothetical protein
MTRIQLATNPCVAASFVRPPLRNFLSAIRWEFRI